MLRLTRVFLALAFVLASAGVLPAQAAPAFAPTNPPPQSLAGLTPQVLSTCDPDGTQASGAIYRICMPPDWWWNGDLVIYAHGYVAFNKPVAIPEDQLCLPDGTCIPELVNTLGYAFATTSYSVNGLAVVPALADILDLVAIFSASYGAPRRVFIAGVSEGGLITALSAEQHPEVFAGGLATCGPVGDFNYQLNYIGDFRVLFDYFYPGLIPGSPVNIPPALIDGWETYYQTTVRPTVFDPANRAALLQLLRVAKAPFDPTNFVATAEQSVRDALWYNVIGANDAAAKLGGQPFDNLYRLYRGSLNDAQLNATVARFSADPAALAAIEADYETSGLLHIPLVTMHTLLDQQVPYGHEPLYRAKVMAAGSSANHVNIPIARYGHCNFTITEVMAAFGAMVLLATAEPLNAQAVQVLLPEAAQRAEFERLIEQALPASTR